MWDMACSESQKRMDVTCNGIQNAMLTQSYGEGTGEPRPVLPWQGSQGEGHLAMRLAVGQWVRQAMAATFAHKAHRLQRMIIKLQASARVSMWGVVP